MKIASTTACFYTCRDREDKLSHIEAVRRLKAAGFEHIDLTLTFIDRPSNLFCCEDWEKKAYALREEAEKLGVTFVQSHAPFVPRRSLIVHTAEEVEHFRQMLMRSQRISEICAVPNIVIHPLSEGNSTMEDFDSHVRYNYEFYDEFLSSCDKSGICACFENLPLGYGQYAAQILALMNGQNIHNVAACWDFGHGQIAYPKRAWSDADQAAAIKSLKGHIRAVHVHDNLGKDDNHLLPFLGIVKWEKVLPALRVAGFTGDLVFEIKQNEGMPYDLMDDSMGFCAKVGEKLIELFERG